MPAKRSRSSKSDSKGAGSKKGKHESSSEGEEAKTRATSSTAKEEEKEESKARAGRYQLGPSESSPRLIDLQGKVVCVSVGNTITLQGTELTVEEASPDKCRLRRVTLEDRDQKFAEAKQQVQKETNKRQEDIRALEAQTTQLLLRMQEDIDNADDLATQLGTR